MTASKVKTLSIISIVLGVIGLFSALIGALAYVGDPQQQVTALNAAGKQPAAVVQVQQEMTGAIMALTESWKTYNGIVLIVSLFVSAALLTGGIMGLQHRESGRRVLATTYAVAMPLKVAQGVASVYIGIVTMQLMQEYMPKMMQAMAPPGRALPPGTDAANSIAQASAMFGVAVGLGWILMQLGFYIVGSIYLRKPDVRAVFNA